MNKRPLDKTKKSNIKCEHCKYWQARSTTDWFKRLFHCSNPESPKSEQVTKYWNRCKCFEWKGGKRMTAEELNQIKNERDEMEKHMTDMFDLAFMINNHDDLAKSQEHHEKLSRMVTHYMGNIQQSYGYMSEKAIKALEREPCDDCVSRQAVIEPAESEEQT